MPRRRMLLCVGMVGGVLRMDLPLELRAGISEASFCLDWKFQNLYEVTFV
jgi:hypothetical protein